MMTWATDILPVPGVLWTLTNATMVGGLLTLQAGGSATCQFVPAGLAELPGAFQVHVVHNAGSDWKEAPLAATFVIIYDTGAMRTFIPLTSDAENIIFVQAGLFTTFTFSIVNNSAGVIACSSWGLLPQEPISVTPIALAEAIAEQEEITLAAAAADAYAQAVAEAAQALLDAQSYADTIPIYTQRITAGTALIGSALIGSLSAGKITTGTLSTCTISLDVADSNNKVTISNTGIRGYVSGVAVFELTHTGLVLGAGAVITSPTITGGVFQTRDTGNRIVIDSAVDSNRILFYSDTEHEIEPGEISTIGFDEFGILVIKSPYCTGGSQASVTLSGYLDSSTVSIDATSVYISASLEGGSITLTDSFISLLEGVLQCVSVSAELVETDALVIFTVNSFSIEDEGSFGSVQLSVNTQARVLVIRWYEGEQYHQSTVAISAPTHI